MSRLIILFLLSVVAIMQGCSGINSCISVGGEYEGVQGNVQYCFSPKGSDQMGAPTYEGEKEGEEKVLLPKKDILDIASMIRDSKIGDALGIKSSLSTPCALILEVTKAYRESQNKPEEKVKEENQVKIQVK